MKNEQVVVKQFPFLSILQLIFITLKLTGHITWSWWWVLSPTWIPILIVLSLLLIVLLYKIFSN